MQAAQRLAQALQREMRPAERAQLELRLAAIAARQGRFDESLATVQRLRAAQAAGSVPAEAETTAWMQLVEGLAALHRAPESASPEALARAQALARLAPGSEVEALAAAWLAHLHFNQGRMSPFATQAARARELAGAAPGLEARWPAALARVALTVATAWMSAGQESIAQGWFGCARESAGSAGDSLLMAAVLHDRAAFGVPRLRIGWALATPGAAAPPQVQEQGQEQGQEHEQEDAHEHELARLQLDASRNYEAAVRAQALAELQPLARIALLVVQSRHEEALDWIEQTLPRLGGAGLARYDAQLRADRLWCHLALRRPADALAEGADIEARIVHTPDPDDRLIVHATLARALRLAGQEEAAAQQEERAAHEHVRMQAAWEELGAELRGHGLDQPPPARAPAAGARTDG
jgi:hypothetical protein